MPRVKKVIIVFSLDDRPRTDPVILLRDESRAQSFAFIRIMYEIGGIHAVYAVAQTAAFVF